MNVEVNGADFSGAKTPDIYYASAYLNDRQLKFRGFVHCDDRLDLFAAIQGSRTLWGLDFPFALPIAAYHALGLRDWEDLLTQAVFYPRSEFMTWLDQLGLFEGRCGESNMYCRHTDAVLRAYSPFKRFNPGMRAMLYSGLKLLRYVKNRYQRIYPFGEYPDVAEVYPSHTWSKVGLRRTTDLAQFTERFNALNIIEVVLPRDLHIAPTQDAADSFVACVTMAAVVTQFDFREKTCPPNVTSQEWDARHLEGLILRI